jgi:hypothetical protein
MSFIARTFYTTCAASPSTKSRELANEQVDTELLAAQALPFPHMAERLVKQAPRRNLYGDI